MTTPRWRPIHILAACTLLLVSASAAAAAAASPADGPWSGSVQSVLDVTTGTYARKETQTWALTGEPPTLSGQFRIYNATWSVTGQGSLKRAQGSQVITTTWTVNVPKTSVQLAIFVRASDQKLIIRQWSSPRQAPGAITGTRQVTVNGQPGPTTQVTAAASEWSFEWIESDQNQTETSGSKTSNAHALPADFHFPGAPVANATCTWQFTTGSADPSPSGPPREPAPQLLSISPAEVSQGAPDVPITLKGQGTHWQTDLTTADFGPDIRVAELKVKSPTEVEAWIQVYSSAAIGPRAVKLTTLRSNSPEVVSLPDQFTVNAVLTAITVPGLIGSPTLETKPQRVPGEPPRPPAGGETGTVDVAPVRPPERTGAPEPPTEDVAPVRPPERTAAPEPAAPSRSVRERLPGGGLTALRPAIVLVMPNSAAQWGENFTITVTGNLTNFERGATTIDLGPGVIWAGDYFTVESPTRVLGSFKIAGDAAPGPRTVTVHTGNETLTLPDAFTVTPRAARDVFRLTPESGQQGQQNLTVNINTFQWRYFVLGTTAEFGPGITVKSFEVQSEFAARAVIDLDHGAGAGPRAVTVRRPDGRVDVFTDVFTVAAAPPAQIVSRPGAVLRRPGAVPVGSPPSLSLSPNHAVRGSTNVYVMITGSGTNFVHPVTTADFGPGIAVQFVEVPEAPLQAKAVVNIAPNAVPGKRTVTVTTNNEVVTVTDGFLVRGAATPPQASSDQYSMRRDRKLVAGAVLVNRFDFLTASASATSGGFARAGQRVFFQARKGTENGLWTSDGTPGNTRFVSPMQPRNLTGAGNRVFFTAVSPGQGEMLWITDGTASGTQVVKDVRAGSNASSFFSFHDGNGTLYFVMETLNAVGTTQTFELWRSDGTAAGTIPLKTNIGISNGQQTLLAPANGAVYFVATERMGSTLEHWLWKTDGTAAGTVKVHEMAIGSSGGRESSRPLRAAGHQLFLVGNGAGNLNAGGPDFWRSNGTAQGTGGLVDINPDPRNDVRSIIDLVPVNNTMFFSVLDCLPSPTWEVWRSDGTPAGTVLVKAGLNRGSYGAMFPTASNGQLYFHGNVGGGTYGLWKSDGTATGTVLVKAVNLPYSPWQLAAPQPIVGVDDTVFFAAGNDALWKSDGTGPGTTLVHSFAPSDLTDAGGALVYRAPPQADSGAAYGLWTAGTAVSLTSNDMGPTGVGLKVALVSGPAHGTLALGENGGFIYQPHAGYTGTDQFTYTVNDGAETSTPAIVSIQVQP